MSAPQPGIYRLAVALAALAGAVDAIGFLHFGELYVSFMSGNTTQAGLDAAAGRVSGVGAALSLIAAFVTGVVAGELAGAGAGRWRIAVLLAVLALSLAGVTALVAAQGRPTAATGPLLALVMGLQNAVLHRQGAAGLALTYVTGTLVNLGRALADAAMGRGPWRVALRFAGLWAGLCTGAVLGAVLAMRDAGLALGCAAGAAALLCALSLLLLEPRAPR
ncbi:YoaK family protein [Pseudoroseicyclus aestuarii]|uniref:Uncharacterized membrane protein YoaK (UPF0700 family) n=1 Tax=Pseudoroseicyclus aestuarii TaxID=1795041 RepID=A0A318SW09_9RHOB|nr:YoaK family protein [Pseudoroseicyclus aestuarii]PYE84536.1 uncharacterized membrane protein YoaK (UPF0700 family) [Pseudoroseicyclus aestuarii]